MSVRFSLLFRFYGQLDNQNTTFLWLDSLENEMKITNIEPGVILDLEIHSKLMHEMTSVLFEHTVG